MADKYMCVREFIEYAKEYGYNSTKFELLKDNKHMCYGSVLDAYYEFVQIPFIGDGFVRISDLEKSLGYDIKFRPIDDETYNLGIEVEKIIKNNVLDQNTEVAL